MPRLVFGASVRRVEDPPLLRGEGRYVDDLQPSDCLHAVFLRSHLAHALIRSIDIEAASKATGVVALWSAPDFIDLEPLEIESAVDGMTIPERRVLASGRVRHVGEALAMLIAESAAQARDALELVELDLDPLPAVTDVERALQEGAQLLYPEFGTNLAFQNASRHGPVKRSFDRAQVIVRERLLNQRLIPSALEPRGALAWLDDERLTLQISSQSTFGVREAVAASLGIDEKDLRVIVRDVGGGFGSKGGCLGEEIAVAAAARRLRRPVKWIPGTAADNCRRSSLRRNVTEPCWQSARGSWPTWARTWSRTARSFPPSHRTYRPAAIASPPPRTPSKASIPTRRQPGRTVAPADRRRLSLSSG